MTEKNEDIIEMTDENGETYKAEVIEIVNFENQEYAVLAPAEDKCSCGEDDCDCSDYVLMRIIKEGEDYSFETIDDDEEFEKVSNYVNNLADEIEDQL